MATLRNDGFKESEIKVYQKTVIIQKSIQEVQRRAKEQDVIRNSPHRYKEVKSKVSRCLKVQSKVAKKKVASRNKSTMQNMMTMYDNRYSESPSRNNRVNPAQSFCASSTHIDNMNKEFVKPMGKLPSNNFEDVDRDLRSIKKKNLRRKRSA